MKCLVVAATLVAALLPAVPARAYFLTCGNAVDLITNGTQSQSSLAVGHAAGAADVLAGLLCLAGSPACACLSNVVTSRSSEFSAALGEQLAQCYTINPNDAAFGAGMRAARAVCGL